MAVLQTPVLCSMSSSIAYMYFKFFYIYILDLVNKSNNVTFTTYAYHRVIIPCKKMFSINIFPNCHVILRQHAVIFFTLAKRNRNNNVLRFYFMTISLCFPSPLSACWDLEALFGCRCPTFSLWFDNSIHASIKFFLRTQVLKHSERWAGEMFALFLHSWKQKSMSFFIWINISIKVSWFY